MAKKQERKEITKEEVETIFSEWWNTHVVGSPIGGSTAAYNHLHGTFPILKEKVMSLASDPETKTSEPAAPASKDD